MHHTLTSRPDLLAIVIGYFLLMAVVGAFFSKKKYQKTVQDYALAGKGLGSLVLVGTFMATWMGGGTVTGGGNSLAYNFGLWPAVCYCLPSVLAVTCLYGLGPVVRRRGKLTVAALLEESYGHNARILSAAIVALAAYSIVSYQYRGLGLVLNATTGMTTNMATLICCVIIIFLAYSGGLKSVAVTDAVSAFIMLFGLLLAVPFLLKFVGGWGWVQEQTAAQMPLGLTFTAGWGVKEYLVNYLPLFLLAVGDQNMFQRMAAGKDDKSVKIGMLGWAAGVIIANPIVAILAYVGRLYFGANIAAGQALLATSTLLPTVVGGMLLAAASAFIITTGDSYLLSGSTSVATDIYGQLKKNTTDQELLKVTKWSIIIFGLFALGILFFFPSILAIQYWSYTIYGAGITPALLGCIICPGKVTKWGGISSMVVGTLLTIVWEACGQPFGIGTALVAFPVSLFLLVVVSALTPKSHIKVAYTGKEERKK